ncbi:hypothetical protein acdb102_25150 [Acidothermaceae bacterium B102]|nr:hypothetical protein acdb102_25150 [Acidothermaceae bacterium B102]
MAGTRIVRAGLAAGTALTLVAATFVAPASAADSRTAQVASDAAWIRQGQLPDGALAWYVDRQRINPYLGNYAAIGLAEAYKVTHTTADLTAASAWLAWYAAHENAQGFVTDYTVSTTGVETSTGDMDSTDAYAGTFLLAVRAVSRAGGNVKSLSAGVHGAVTAIEATQDSDGLTWAKPTWQVKYLMDESEVYAGLRAAADLGTTLGDRALRTRASTDASAVATGVSGLWDPSTQAYDWARDGGSQVATNWANLYSDSMEQAWASTFGVASPTAGLMTTLDADHPLWDQPGASDTINGSPGTVGYWPVAGWGFLANGATGRAATAATNIRSAALAANRAWPFTTGNAGQLIVLESADLSLVS